MKEKLSRLALSFALAIALYAAFLPTASADDVAESLHVAVDGTGAYLFSISGEISEGDEYISADNILYRIETVQNGNAIAEKIGEETMPDVSWLDVGQAQPVFAQESAVPAASATMLTATSTAPYRSRPERARCRNSSPITGPASNAENHRFAGVYQVFQVGTVSTA